MVKKRATKSSRAVKGDATRKAAEFRADPASASSELDEETQSLVLEAATHVNPQILNLRAENPADTEQALNSMRKAIARSVDEPGANSIIDELALLYSYCSSKLLPDYATLDAEHVESVRSAVHRIEDYLKDPSLSKPLNFLLLASPGSGKSQLIKSIATYLANDRKQPVKDVVFNMATMQRNKDDLGRVLDDARDAKVDGKLPLVFIDEFDSDESHYPLLLPLLWDGCLDVGRRELRLGRSVFFLAGSRRTLPAKLAQARDIAADWSDQSDDNKLVDLFSRINGTVITLPAISEDQRGPDKAVIAMTMLRRRFKNCRKVPCALIWFIAKTKFRYDARSIGALVSLIPLPSDQRADEVEEIKLQDLETMPLVDPQLLQNSPLSFHLVHRGDAWKICELWKQAKRYDKQFWLATENLKSDWPDLSAIVVRLLALTRSNDVDMSQ